MQTLNLCPDYPIVFKVCDGDLKFFLKLELGTQNWNWCNFQCVFTIFINKWHDAQPKNLNGYFIHFLNNFLKVYSHSAPKKVLFNNDIAHSQKGKKIGSNFYQHIQISIFHGI